MPTPATIEEYLSGLDPKTAEVVQHIRERLRAAVPDAEEAIAYAIPTLKLDGRNLVHFAGWAKHVSLYPEPPGDDRLTADLAPYSSGRGTLKFPLSEPIPDGLLERIAAALVATR